MLLLNRSLSQIPGHLSYPFHISQVICSALSQVPGHLSCLFTDTWSSVLPFHRSLVICPALSQIPGHLSCLFTDPGSSVLSFSHIPGHPSCLFTDPRSFVLPFHRSQVICLASSQITGDLSYPFSFRKLAMWLETGIGSKLLLTLFDVTHLPCQSWYVLTTKLAPQHQRDGD